MNKIETALAVSDVTATFVNNNTLWVISEQSTNIESKMTSLNRFWNSNAF